MNAMYVNVGNVHHSVQREKQNVYVFYNTDQLRGPSSHRSLFPQHSLTKRCLLKNRFSNLFPIRDRPSTRTSYSICDHIGIFEQREGEKGNGQGRLGEEKREEEEKRRERKGRGKVGGGQKRGRAGGTGKGGEKERGRLERL